LDVLKSELHCHNEYSNSHLGDLEPYHDCNITVPEQLEQCRKMGLDMIFVTNHNTLDGYSTSLEYKENHEFLKNLKIYPAEEVTADTGAHILAYGISESIKPGLTVEEILDEIKSQGAVSSAPHPFEIFNGIREKAFLCDMIEVFNSCSIDKYSNIRAKQFAEKYNMVQVTGSDSHVISTLGRCVNLIDSENNLDDVLSSMKKGRISFRNTSYITDKELMEHISYKVANSKDFINSYLSQIHPKAHKFLSLLYKIFELNPNSHLWTVFFKLGKRGMNRISYKINFKNYDPSILCDRNLTTILKMGLLW